jgi:hypothetical protein
MAQRVLGKMLLEDARNVKRGMLRATEILQQRLALDAGCGGDDRRHQARTRASVRAARGGLCGGTAVDGVQGIIRALQSPSETPVRRLPMHTLPAVENAGQSEF